MDAWDSHGWASCGTLLKVSFFNDIGVYDKQEVMRLSGPWISSNKDLGRHMIKRSNQLTRIKEASEVWSPVPHMSMTFLDDVKVGLSVFSWSSWLCYHRFVCDWVVQLSFSPYVYWLTSSPNLRFTWLSPNLERPARKGCLSYFQF